MNMAQIENIIVNAIPFFFLLMGIEIIYNYFSHRGYYKAKDSMANLGTGILSQLAGFLIKPAKILAYSWVFYNWNIDKAFNLGLWSTDLTTTQGIVTWIIGFLLIDMLYYWFHRHAHEVNLLWSAHVVHHSSEEYNLSVALRQSTLQGLFSLPYYLPAALLGIDPIIYMASYGLNLIYQFWIHTRFVPKLGPLEWILCTPSHHRVHHARQMKYLDRNHAGVLIIWDKLFGTFHVEEEEPIYGIYPRFKSYNAVMANIDPIIELVHYFRIAKPKDKLKVLFGSPMWLYENYKKTEFKPTKWNKTAYTPIAGSIVFGLVLVVSLYVLNFAPTIPVALTVGLSLLVLVGLYIMGMILDKTNNNAATNSATAAKAS
jgi:alkylglycerol monooxygenase